MKFRRPGECHGTRLCGIRLCCIRLCVILPCLIWHFSYAAFGFAASYFVSHTYWQLVPQRIISANIDRGTAAGINALRRLKVKRCGELASRLSSRLTFAYLCMVVRVIHSSRLGISAWSFMQITWQWRCHYGYFPPDPIIP